MSRIEYGTLDGPWEHSVWFELPGPARSKSNSRRFGNAGDAERAAYQRNKKFVADVRLTAKAAVPAGWPLGRGLDLQDRPQVLAVVAARTVLDATNVPKSLHDALEGILFLNDASVRDATQLTVRGRDGGGLAAFVALPAGTCPQQRLQLHVELVRRVADLTASLIDGFQPLGDGHPVG